MSSDPLVIQRFQTELDWLKKRETIWTGCLWQVALVGVTSSGKSTLVNALLDEAVLPMRVRPSSNSLVICRWGERKQAVVHFVNGTVMVLEGETLADRVKDLSDETTNSGNHAGVREIELHWPGFRLGREVAIIDTPGLDAYGFERHEKLTMETLLPTVDLVVFLTTAKASSDALIDRYLEEIHRHQKPLILVQNMMDSIEEVKSMGGKIERTREEVAGDHRRRLTRLLQSRSWGKNNEVPIMQVSAQLAVNGNYMGSKVSQLVKVIEAKLKKLGPELYLGRLGQLYKELNRIILANKIDNNNDIEYKAIAYELQKNELEKIQTDLHKSNINVSKYLEKTIEKFVKTSETIKIQLDNISSRDIDNVYRLLESLQTWFSELGNDLGQILIDFKDIIAPIMQLLNIRGEDLRVERPLPPKAPPISPQVVDRQQVTIRDKPGCLNWLARKLTPTSWGKGREEIAHFWKELQNVPAFRTEVLNAIGDELSWAKRAKLDILRAAEHATDTLVKEVERRLTGLEAPTRTIIQEIKQKAVVSSLEVLCRDIRTLQGYKGPTPPATLGDGQSWSETRLEMEIPTLLHDLTEYADLVARRRFLHCRQALLQRVSKGVRGNVERALIWGFDEDSVERFLGRFWFDVLSGKPGPGSCLEVIQKSGAFQTVGVGLEVPLAQDPPDLKCQVARFLEDGPTAVFVLLDALQIGNTPNQWRRSALHLHMGKAGGFILVIQSIAGLVESPRLAEGLWEILKLAHGLTPVPAGILVNDDETTWTVLADALFTEGDSIRTQADIQNWLVRMEIEDLSLRQRVADVLKEWLVLLNLDRSRK